MKVEPTGNLLLDSIPSAKYPTLFAQLKVVSLEASQLLYEARAPIDYAYFPKSGTLSAVVVFGDGGMIEVATIGKEGAVGLPVFGAAKSSPNKVFAQVPGESLRIEAKAWENVGGDEGPLRRLLLQYHSAFMFQVSQSVACNGRHVVQERCCRWLLMTLDSVEGDEVELTHEFLSFMLGVRRSSVTEVLQELKELGLINYTRGKIKVVDREGLEERACECYKAVRDEYARLLG